MGYESKLYVVVKTNVLYGKKRYARVIAMFDMRKFTQPSDILRTFPETDCYIYADDGDTQILEDRYGKPLTEASIDKVIEILGTCLTNGCDSYDQAWAALEYLKTIYAPYKKDLAVLHYGY